MALSLQWQSATKAINSTESAVKEKHVRSETSELKISSVVGYLSSRSHRGDISTRRRSSVLDDDDAYSARISSDCLVAILFRGSSTAERRTQTRTCNTPRRSAMPSSYPNPQVIYDSLLMVPYFEQMRKYWVGHARLLACTVNASIFHSERSTVPLRPADLSLLPSPSIEIEIPPTARFLHRKSRDRSAQ